MKAVDVVAFVLVIVGALNWGLVGLFRFDLVAAILGTGVLASVVYALVGLAGVYELATLKGAQKRWSYAHA
jgi:uncharacterized membrane protein YuzA (DUF378 family)